MGCPDAPYIVFLCSSRTIWEDESSMVTAMADALARELGDAAPTLVVRPHPTNPKPFETFSHPGVVIHPKGGDQADSPDSWQEYYDQLTHASCVFGLNTTAFLESVVVDRPCLTIVTETYWPAQGRTGHFRHLLKGKFLEICRVFADVATHVRRILDGVEGLKFFDFSDRDVVRHPLVAKIVTAYDRIDREKAAAEAQAAS